MLLRASRCGERIKEIRLRKADPYSLVLTAKDIPGENSISIFSDTRPLMAADTIAYPGEIILAVFSPDYESARIQMRQIEVETEESDYTPSPALPEALEYSWGEAEEGEFRTCESSFEIRHTAKPDKSMYSVIAWIDGGKVHIETPCEWPELIRTAVSGATGYPKESVIVHQVLRQSSHDEFLINPAIVAAIAATGAIRTEMPCEIRDFVMISRPGIKVSRTTAIDEEGKPVSERVSMTVDMGASPVLPAEYQKQAITGLIPPYPLKEFRASVSIACSSAYPAAFCGSLGYAEALAATEYHVSRLAEKTDLTPYSYRISVEKEKRKFTDYIPGFDLEDQKKTAKRTALQSTYDRKWFANNFQRHSFGLIGYIKGIGIATGSGISGFSTSFARSVRFQSTITYTQKETIAINTSALRHPGMLKHWKTIVSDRINPGHPESVTFLEQGPHTMDAGPDVLSRIISSFTPQLESAAKKLAVLKETEIPASITFETQNTSLPCEFQNNASATVIAEIVTSELDFIPTATEVWASIIIPNAINTATLKNSIKRNILNTIEECGFRIPDGFRIHLDITVSGADTSVSSVGMLMKALTMGALADALYQLGGPEASILPASGRHIANVLIGDSDES